MERAGSTGQRRLTWLGLLATVLVVFWVFPRPYADPTTPEAERAFALVESLATQPHPAGSQANRAVRDELVSTLRRMGLRPEVQTETVADVHPTRGGRSRVANVSNIIATIRGDERSSVLLMGHYDSQVFAPGAADGLTGVSAVLEAARALTKRGKPERDVIVLLTDGEEMGLLGAQAFFRSHPLAQDVGVVLNFEARGSSGPVFMFETGSNNAGIVDAFVAADGRSNGTSLSYEIYKRMSNDTDFSISKAAGVSGLNFAFVDGYLDYHLATDTPENLDRVSHAEMVSTAVAMATHFAFAPSLPTADQDATYFELVPGLTLHYPTWLGHLMVALAVILVIVCATRLPTSQPRWLRCLGWSLIAGMTTILVASNLLEGTIDSLSPAFEQRNIRQWYLYQHRALLLALVFGLLALTTVIVRNWLTRSPFMPAMLGIAAFLLAISITGNRFVPGFIAACALIAVTRFAPRRITAESLQLVGMAVWAVGALVLAATMPQASYVFSLPLVATAIAIISERRLVVWIAWLFTLIFWVPIVYTAYLGLGIFQPQFIAIVLILVLWLHIQLIVSWPRVFVAGAAGVSLVAVVFALVSPFSQRYPRVESLYVIDPAGPETLWATEQPADWNRSLFADARSEDASQFWPFVGSAKVFVDTGPSVTKAPLQLQGRVVAPGRYEATVSNPDLAFQGNLYLPQSLGVRKLTVNEKEVDLGRARNGWHRVRWIAPRSGDVVVLDFDGEGEGEGEVMVVTRHLGLPVDAGRPEDSVPPPYSRSDSIWQPRSLVINESP